MVKTPAGVHEWFAGENFSIVDQAPTDIVANEHRSSMCPTSFQMSSTFPMNTGEMARALTRLFIEAIFQARVSAFGGYVRKGGGSILTQSSRGRTRCGSQVA
jgi:hypothetical protein